MNHRQSCLKQGQALVHVPDQKPRNSGPPQRGILQPKMATSSQIKKPPVAPPAYRPQLAPKILQPKIVITAQNRNQPVAPPVYRTQPVPKVLQTKTAGGRQSLTGQSLRPPVAPPVYRPEPNRFLQPKMTAAGRALKPAKAPPVYRPQPTPSVLQAKSSETGITSAQYTRTKAHGEPPHYGLRQGSKQHAGLGTNHFGSAKGLGGRAMKAASHHVEPPVVTDGMPLQAKVTTTTASGRRRSGGSIKLSHSSSPSRINKSSGLIQRKKTEASRIAEGDWASVSSKGTLAFTSLAAGCLAVVAGFADGGGAGVHLAMNLPNASQWSTFRDAIAAKRVETVYLYGDMVGVGDGWYVNFGFDEDYMPSPQSELSPMAALELTPQYGGQLPSAESGWSSATELIKQWFKETLGAEKVIYYSTNGAVIHNCK